MGYLLAILYALPTLLYPYGRDQALYAYVAWGWLQGYLPYVDSFDQKPPGIYLIYGLGYLLLGNQSWGIRALELCALLGIGRLLAELVGVPLLGGLAALLLVGFHVTIFDYWHTGQIEIWEVLCICLAMVLAGKARPGLSGFFAGMAFVFKFPSLPLILVVCGFALFCKRQLSTFFWFMAGSLVPALILLPWILLGEWNTLYEALILYNRAYMDKEGHILELKRLWLTRAWIYTQALQLLGLCGLLISIYEKKLERGLWFVALLGAAVASVLWQDKLYPYHWTVAPPFAVGIGVWGAARLVKLRPSLVAMLYCFAALTVTVGYSNAPGWFHNNTWNYQRYVPTAWSYLKGDIKDNSFLSSFQSTHAGGFNAAVLKKTAELINKLKKDGDTLCMRGFDPDLNNQTGLRCTSRFVADFPIMDAKIQHPMKQAWLKEYWKDLKKQPPVFLVVGEKKINRLEVAQKAGYLKVGKAGKYIILKKGA